MLRFMLIAVPDTKYKYHFAELLTKFFDKYPEAELVSVDLKELRALAVIREKEDTKQKKKRK